MADQAASQTIQDPITETYIGNTYLSEVRASSNTQTELCGAGVCSFLELIIDGHISHLRVTFSEDVPAFPGSKLKLQRVAKLRIPAVALTKNFTLNQITSEVLVAQGTWTPQKASKYDAKPESNRKLWELVVRFSLARCAIEGLRVKSTAENQSLHNLRVHLGGASNTQMTPPQPLSDVSLHIVLGGTDKVRNDFEDFSEIVNLEAAVDPLKKWYPGTKRYQLQIGQSLSIAKHPFYVLKPVYAFFPDAGCGMNDFLTRMGFGLMQDHEYVCKHVAPTTRRSGHVVLIQSAGLGDRAYFGLLSNDAEDETIRYQPGDILEINFEPQGVGEKIWVASVQEPLPYAPYGQTTVIINRPWDRVRAKYTDPKTDYPCLQLEELGNTEKTVAAVNEATKIPVTFKCQVSEKVFGTSISAMEQMFKTYQLYEGETGETFAPSDAQINDRAVLLNNAPDLLPEIDFYASVRESYAKQNKLIDDEMTLNDEQKEVIELCQHAPGGWVLVQGPPGTGKTHLIIQAICPFLIADTNEQVLLVSSTNAGVDSMARKADSMIQKLKTDQFANNKFVVRVHSSDTEEVISLREGKLKRVIPADAKPKIYTLNEKDTKIIDEIEAARVIHNRYLSSIKEKFSEVRDPRVQELKLSLGFRMFQVLDPTAADEELLPNRYDENNRDKYASVIEAYLQYGNGETFGTERMIAFRELLNNLRQDILNHAAVVVTTTATAGSFSIFETVRPTIIIVDEAARALETDLLSLSIRYPLAIGKMLVGDTFQLRPVVRSLNPDHNQPRSIFAHQLSVSTMDRLQMSGFRTIMLKTQFRAIPEIMKPYSKLVYHGQLRNGVGTAKTDRPLAAKIAEYNAVRFNKGTPIIFFEIAHARAEFTATKSQFNPMFCAFGVNLVTDILQQDFMKDEGMGSAGRPTVGVLMPYQAQYLGYTAAQDSMMLRKLEGLDQVTFDKIDRQQGNEWDIVIIDLTITRSVGFLKDIGRLNVLFSRARTALYIIGNRAALDNMRDRSVQGIQKFYNEYHQFRFIVPDAHITSPHVNINRVDVDHSAADASWAGAISTASWNAKIDTNW